MRDQNEIGIYVIFGPPMKSSTITRDGQRDEKQSRAQWHVNSQSIFTIDRAYVFALTRFQSFYHTVHEAAYRSQSLERPRMTNGPSAVT